MKNDLKQNPPEEIRARSFAPAFVPDEETLSEGFAAGIQKAGDELSIYGFKIPMPDRIIFEYGDDPDIAGRRITIEGDKIDCVDSVVEPNYDIGFSTAESQESVEQCEAPIMGQVNSNER